MAKLPPIAAARLDALRAAAREWDHAEVDELVAQLLRQVRRSGEPDPASVAALKVLKGARRFDLLADLSDALLRSGLRDAAIRRLHAQALIEEGRLAAATAVLESLAADPSAPQSERDEARGLLGRTYKQVFQDGLACDGRGDARALQRAIEWYEGPWREAPEQHTWHGINVVALLFQAERREVAIGRADPVREAVEAAKRILAVLKVRRKRGDLPAWDLATGLEARLALAICGKDRKRNEERVLQWLDRYVAADADAFEYASTRRQLAEVWELDPGAGLGSELLTTLAGAVLKHAGGRLELTREELTQRELTRRESGRVDHLERVLGDASYHSHRWIQKGMDLARAVCRIEDEFGEARGTGFLVPAGLLGLGGVAERFVLLTNNHVLQQTPTRSDTLRPEEARLRFEAVDQGELLSLARKRLVESTADLLDFSIAELEAPPEGTPRLEVNDQDLALDGTQRVYVIGHPRGLTLSFSFQDNLLLARDERLMHYRAPTDTGSSGSPVFDSSWKLVGLHHAGFSSARPLAYRIPLHAEEQPYPANEGIRIGAIRAELLRRRDRGELGG